MNFRAILVAIAIGFAVHLIASSVSDFSKKDEAQLAIAAFILSAIVFHIKPELLGKLNKPKEEAAEEEDQQLWAFMKVHKWWWLVPIFTILILLGLLIVMTQGSAVAPFIYPLL